jgi:hypothetical protein
MKFAPGWQKHLFPGRRRFPGALKLLRRGYAGGNIPSCCIPGLCIKIFFI